MARRNLAGLRVLVTGASQGIGRALVLSAAQRGAKVIAVARSADLLEEVAREVRSTGGTIAPIVADITNSADRVRMAETTMGQFGGLDILINNAGIGATGHFMDSDPQVLRTIFETNYFALVEVTRTFLPMLKSGTTPAIVNISSVVGRRALPARSLYSSSKFAVQGFSEAIRAELAKDGVDVVLVNPGLTQTNFSKNMLEQKAKLQLDHMRGMTSEQVAEATLRAIEKGRMEVTLTLNGKLLLLVSRLFPWFVDWKAKKTVRGLFAEEIAAREQRRADQAAAPVA